MKINLISCSAIRPDKRAIAKMIEEIAVDIDSYTAQDITEFLLEGSSAEIEVLDKSTSSAFRSLRKHDIEYDLMD